MVKNYHIQVLGIVQGVWFRKYTKESADVYSLKGYVKNESDGSVYIEVEGEDIPSETKFKSNEAFYTFVAVDQSGRPIDVPELVPETEEEIELYEGALRRRQLRLVLAKRMKPEDAKELQSIFKVDN